MQSQDFEQEHIRNPYPLYARMRGEPGLVRHPVEGYYFVARYRDVREAVMRIEDFSSEIMSAMVRANPLTARLPNSLTSSVDVLAVADNPSHEVHRRMMKRHFTRSPVADVVEKAKPRIGAKLDALIRKGGGDFAVHVSSTVPVETTLDLLSFPISDTKRLKGIVDGCVELLAGQFPRHKVLHTLLSGYRLMAYVRAGIRAGSERPEEASPVLKALFDAVGEQVIAKNLMSTLVAQLIAAGVDSTSSLIGNALRMLAESPELAARLRADPALVAPFLEECVRLEAPFQGHFRVVTRPCTLAGQELRAGERLMLLWGSANRDSDVFECPDELVLDRARTANGHMSFGYGYHLCLGAELARATAKELVLQLLERTREIALAEAPPVQRPSPYLRTLTSLPLRVVAA